MCPRHHFQFLWEGGKRAGQEKEKLINVHKNKFMHQLYYMTGVHMYTLVHTPDLTFTHIPTDQAHIQLPTHQQALTSSHCTPSPLPSHTCTSHHTSALLPPHTYTSHHILQPSHHTLVPPLPPHTITTTPTTPAPLPPHTSTTTPTTYAHVPPHTCIRSFNSRIESSICLVRISCALYRSMSRCIFLM